MKKCKKGISQNSCCQIRGKKNDHVSLFLRQHLIPIGVDKKHKEVGGDPLSN